MRGKTIIFILINVFISWKGWCQYNSLNSKFSVDERKGCAGLNIKITNNVSPPCGASGIYCAIDYGDGRNAKPFVNGDIANYPTAGDFTLKIVYSTDTTKTDSIHISITPNDPPAFEPYSCNGNKVSVNVTESKYAYYIFNYNDTTAEVMKAAISASDVHTYTSSGTRNVSVRGYNGPGTADNCVSNTLPVTVASTLPAAAISQVEVVDAASVKVDFASDPSIQYKFMIGTNNAASFQQYKTIYSPSATTLTETIPSIRPENNYYCFRVDTNDPCANTVAASSSTICSLTFDAVAQNNQNKLSWAMAAASGTHPLSDFTVMKNSTALTPTFPSTQSSYTDTDIVCGTAYTYQLQANYPGNVKSLSLIKSLTAISTDVPTAIKDISAVVNPAGNEVQLTWIQDPAFNATEYTLLKSANGNYTPLTTTDQTNFTDNSYTTGSGSCYKIQYIDACKNKSAQSLEACPVALTGNVEGDNTINITWTPYTGWTNGVKNYVIEIYDGNGDLIDTKTQTTTTYTDNNQDPTNQVYQYVIYAYANDGAVIQSISNALELIKHANINYPTAFTPDHLGPSENETFKVFGNYISKFELQVFNRWGELLYSTDDINKGWDGRYSGKDMPEGTYAFRVRGIDLIGRSYDRTGAVFLIRKR
ncbi:MAG TPA: T9SS type B sorting domain-containing protein [Ohtaekwangia sp.]|uniref:T9SS type B sorting domain-containing protein n=1 Tax=Ohtaekwangia sp. TaxID=2066019 RepID=UPI002F959C62